MADLNDNDGCWIGFIAVVVIVLAAVAIWVGHDPAPTVEEKIHAR